MRHRSVLLLPFFALAACGGSDPAPNGNVGPSAIDAEGAAPRTQEAVFSADRSAGLQASGARMATAPEATQEFADEKLIRRGSAILEVDSLEAAMDEVRALAERVNGIVADVRVRAGQSRWRQASMELRLPATHFDVAVAALEPIGTVEQLTLSTQDVTEEFMDLEARVENSRRLEERLLRLLAERTGDLDQVLRAERELARVRGEIERVEGRLRYLQDRVDISRIQVTLKEPVPVTPRPGPDTHPIVEAFKDAWRNAVLTVAGLIAAAGIWVPNLLLLGILGWAVVRLGRRVLKRRRPR